MSKALGAAFLSHQVEQLESKLNKMDVEDRRTSGGAPQLYDPNKRLDKNPQSANSQRSIRGRGTAKVPSDKTQHFQPRKVSGGLENHLETIVLDSSVLIHALDQVHKWCKPHRTEALVVPLEVLNTLDLLKKGNSPLAVRARNASRVLEAQVGVNPRIRVQGDDEFVLWDDVVKHLGPNNAGEEAPEWMRRTICCALWEQKSQSNTRNVDVVGLAISSPLVISELVDPTLSRYAIRADGTVLRDWIQSLGKQNSVKFLEVNATSSSTTRTSGDRPRRDSEGEKSIRGTHHARRTTGGRGRGTERDSGRMVEKVYNGPPLGGVGTGKIRLLARGEKLDP
jgi:hypothetical protein